MPLTDANNDDPRGLIAEAYRMEIGSEDCRSIFFDWALGEAGPELEAKLERLIARHTSRQPDHPMSAVLIEGRGTATARRRGGRSGRVR
ncbi:hypothetical protein [Roseobacter sp. HKCCA0434]|uniref:hypothetical protein n=1 Tax=Roseobacter sp. HKCCA0434 TaxID=3079297 RepID=UPI002905DD9A|nr:hypothetical protein [Roseobacter sp. HKCCA0434]